MDPQTLGVQLLLLDHSRLVQTSFRGLLQTFEDVSVACFPFILVLPVPTGGQGGFVFAYFGDRISGSPG